MEAAFQTWTTSRKIYESYLENYSLAQLNKIPTGFNNNLIWHIGHVVVAQQSLVYRLSSLPMYVSEELFNRYKPGTMPTGNTPQQEVNELKELLSGLVAKTRQDYNAGRFESFTERQTATGFHLATLQEAIDFNNYHEGLHLGYMMSIRKFL